jgi:tetratricopeptide (TPR) repeat protein
MMLSLIVTTVFAVAPAALPVTTAQEQVARTGGALPLKACIDAFEALHEAKDDAGCVKLWQENPHWALVTLASDVEGALAMLEAGDRVDEVEGLQKRALWGARHATQAGLPIVQDYIASLAGLDEYRRTLYRDAQTIYERANSEFAKGEADLAREVAYESVERSVDLGDWWGAAMAFSTLGECYRELGSFEDAIIAFGKARNLYQGLGLMQNEFASLVSMATMANALEHNVRGIEITHAALALHKRLTKLVPDYAEGPELAELKHLKALMEKR